MTGSLYIVATPIGNLSDITLRALEILKSVDVIVCEDTRVTGKLLKHFEISKSLFSYHQHSREKDIHKIKELLSQGKDLAYVTDAGTPGISDPGGRLVEYLYNNFPTAKIIAAPGVSAVTAALSVSGLSADEFNFRGFIPHKKARKKFLEEIADSKITTVFYESVHRIMKLLSEMVQIFPKRKIVIARELTKQFETIYRGTPEEVRSELADDKIKGEFVVIVKGKK